MWLSGDRHHLSFAHPRTQRNKIAKISQRFFRNILGKEVVLGDRHHNSLGDRHLRPFYQNFVVFAPSCELSLVSGYVPFPSWNILWQFLRSMSNFCARDCFRRHGGKGGARGHGTVWGQTLPTFFTIRGDRHLSARFPHRAVWGQTPRPRGTALVS